MLTADQTNRLLNILATHPYRDVADIIAAIVDQGKGDPTADPPDDDPD